MVLGRNGCWISNLAAKLAFFPPRPSTYQLQKEENGKFALVSSSINQEDSSMDVRQLKTKRGKKIVAMYLRNPYARLTLLYSHGNAADLGQLYDLFVQLKLNLRVNLMGYDYSGYGASTGKVGFFFTSSIDSRIATLLLTTVSIVLPPLFECPPPKLVILCTIQPSEHDTYADIEAVYECLQTEYGISQEDLILYGQSVGSGPTLHLAAKLPRLRGVVLHSAILSGLRVLCQLKVTLCCDIYKNINKIKKVKCPVLVIHGTEDDVVNWFHGNGLWQLSREPYAPLWIKGGGHCNLELYPDYIRHLYGFIQEMEKMTTETRLKKIRQTLRPLKTNPNSSSRTAATNKCYCSCSIRCCCWPKCLSCSCPSCSCPDCSCPSCSCPDCSCPSCSCPDCSCLNCSCLSCSLIRKCCLKLFCC